MRTKYFSLIFLSIILIACTPSKKELDDLSVVNLSLIDSIAIVPNHSHLVADGRSTIDLRPRLFYKKNGETIQIIDGRVKDEWFEYTNISNGGEVSRYYSTKDLSLSGKEISIKVKLKEHNLESTPVTINVVAPLPAGDSTFIPVIFHICQTTDDVDKYGGDLSDTKINSLLKRMNGVFSRENDSNYPVGMNGKVKFKLARYNPDGELLFEPGINRVVRDSVNAYPITDQTAHAYDKFIFDNELIWPTDKYLNIWLISERISRETQPTGSATVGSTINFTVTLSDKFVPSYFLNSSNPGDLPGISLTHFENQTLYPKDVGIIYKIQLLNSVNKNVTSMDRDIDFLYYVGRFFGLLPTYHTSASVPYQLNNDYCNDTFKYNVNTLHSQFGDRDNKMFYKQVQTNSTTYFFVSENIMDDISGLHTAISQDQYARVMWSLENVVGRQWIPGFALNGTN